MFCLTYQSKMIQCVIISFCISEMICDPAGSVCHLVIPTGDFREIFYSVESFDNISPL